MKQRRRATKRGENALPRAKSAAAKASVARSKGKSGKRKGLSLRTSMAEALKFYRPIKNPVTLRLDADVIAWFKKDGRRYQTRINATLRRVMEREMRARK
jgi:uncharacterized protein (DUF4415 family)